MKVGIECLAGEIPPKIHAMLNSVEGWEDLSSELMAVGIRDPRCRLTFIDFAAEGDDEITITVRRGIGEQEVING